MYQLSGLPIIVTSKAEDILEAWSAFFVAHALAINKIEEGLSSAAALSLDEYDVLLGVSRAPGERIRFAELASVSVFTKSGITRVTSRLEKRGLLHRVQCENDRRGAYALITSKGKEALRDSWKLYSKAILSIFEPCFDQQEARQLKCALQKVVGRIRNDSIVQITKKKRR